jgi:multidrug efflux system membrane fusion protein
MSQSQSPSGPSSVPLSTPVWPGLRRALFRKLSNAVVWHVGVIAVTFGLALSLTGCLETASQAKTKQDVVRPARVAEVAYRTETQKLTLAGVVAPRYETNLGFRVAGKVIAREVEIGTTVQPGQVLARLDDADYRHAVDNARAALAAAEADYGRGKADLERYAQLRGGTAFVPQTFDQRQATANTAQARLDQARTQLALAENNLSYTVLTADVAGVVTSLQAEVGQVLAQGQAMLRLAQTAELEVLVSVPEQRLASVRETGQVNFELWSEPGKHYTAQLRELSPSADPATRTYPARFSMTERPDFVGMGMTATLTLARDSSRPLAELPLSAIYQQGKEAAVWVVDRASGKVTLRPISIARMRDDSVLIGSGITAGELVVIAGVHKLEDGQTVRPVVMPAVGAPQQAMR